MVAVRSSWPAPGGNPSVPAVPSDGDMLPAQRLGRQADFAVDPGHRSVVEELLSSGHAKGGESDVHHGDTSEVVPLLLSVTANGTDFSGARTMLGSAADVAAGRPGAFMK